MRHVCVIGGFGILLFTMVRNSVHLRADDAVTTPQKASVDLPEKGWLVLQVPGRIQNNVQPLPKSSKLVPREEFTLTGPGPGHPFLLGDYTADGRWGVVAGGVQVTGGKNAVLELAHANQFELEGRMDQTNLGGWFMLVGWEDGHGYCISNVIMKQSGAPWFLTEFRGGKALQEAHVEFPSFEWKGEQSFKLRVENNALSLDVGAQKVFEGQELPNYEPGAIMLGTYDTRYGPRALRLVTLRGRALPAANE